MVVVRVMRGRAHNFYFHEMYAHGQLMRTEVAVVVGRGGRALERMAKVWELESYLGRHERVATSVYCDENKKRSTQCCLIKSTNSVIKWTAIMTSLLKDYHYWNENFGLASESWEQL